MIYTVTFNPSLDYIIRVRDFREGKINRTEYERIFAGGKGINVSLVLDRLGHKSTALGFTAGFTGEEIERRLKDEGIACRFIRVKEGHSRINVKMKSGVETEINGQGPKITPENIEELFLILDELTEEDILVISGSVPKILPGDMYEQIMERLNGKNVKIAVDAEKDLLTRVLPYHPFLIKPNNHELSEIFGVDLKTREDVVPYARKIKEKGAVNVLVSMAGEGAVLLDEQGREHMSEAPEGTLVNSVGAGDSMVAGFLAGYLETGDYETAFRMGLCTGSASAFSEELATRKEVEKLMKETFRKGE